MPFWIPLALLSAAAQSAAALLEKPLLRRLRAGEVVELASSMAALISLPLLLLVPWLEISGGEASLIIIAGAAVAAGAYLTTECLSYVEVTVAVPIASVTPAITAAFAYVLLGEKLGRYGWAGIFLLCVGAVLAQVELRRGWLRGLTNNLRGRGMHLLLGGLTLFSASVLIDRAVLRDGGLPSLGYLALIQAVIAVTLNAWFRRPRGRPLRASLRRGGLPLALFSVLTALHRGLQYAALATGPAGAVMALKRTSAVSTVLLGGRIGEGSRGRRTVAAVLAVGGAVLVAVK